MKEIEIDSRGLRPDERWKDFSKEQPKEGEYVTIAYYYPKSVRQYAPVVWNDGFDKDNGIIVTHWYGYSGVKVYKQTFQKGKLNRE